MMESVDRRFEEAIGTHDAAVARAGKEIWVGAEPTFTLRSSEAPEWLSEALGGEKQRYALRIVGELQRRHPGSVVLRTVGRQYAGEARPRWSIGLFERRDRVAVWHGPADPLGGSPDSVAAKQLDCFWDELERSFNARHWTCLRLRIPGALGRRLLLRPDGNPMGELRQDDELLTRPSVHLHEIPTEGLCDPLASSGLQLLLVGELECTPGMKSACIELPAFGRVEDFLACLAALGEAATTAGLRSLVLQGFSPPVDTSIAWTTITPDPAVVEVNQAPQPDVERFLAASRELFDVVQQLGLSPYRLQYNGTVSDSGGGGQFTLGGRSAAASPFFVEPALLPRLVRYFNHHPALSYLFAPEYIGSGSQSPRPDEGTSDAFRELQVALEQLQRQPRPSPEFLWASLAPFLADPSGNAHRSELNIEKLWNPHQPMRGCMGVVEFRAFRMPSSPERAASIVALLRAIAAMLCGNDPILELRDWGTALHDRFALPFMLRRDLAVVLDDLAASEFGLDDRVRAVLLEDSSRSRWTTTFTGCELTLERAVEFWPLVGDVASQEAGGSRLVDSSTVRLQISLRSKGPEGPALAGWQLLVAGHQVPLRSAQDETGEIRLIGLRFRDFAPWRGLHPAIKPYGPLTLTLLHPEMDAALQATLHDWRPDRRPYNGLPHNLDAAAKRRAERFVTWTTPRAELPAPKTPPPEAVTDYCFDLRRL